MKRPVEPRDIRKAQINFAKNGAPASILSLAEDLEYEPSLRPTVISIVYTHFRTFQLPEQPTKDTLHFIHSCFVAACQINEDEEEYPRQEIIKHWPQIRSWMDYIFHHHRTLVQTDVEFYDRTIFGICTFLDSFCRTANVLQAMVSSTFVVCPGALGAVVQLWFLSHRQQYDMLWVKSSLIITQLAEFAGFFSENEQASIREDFIRAFESIDDATEVVVDQLQWVGNVDKLTDEALVSSLAIVRFIASRCPRELTLPMPKRLQIVHALRRVLRRVLGEDLTMMTLHLLAVCFSSWFMSTTGKAIVPQVFEDGILEFIHHCSQKVTADAPLGGTLAQACYCFMWLLCSFMYDPGVLRSTAKAARNLTFTFPNLKTKNKELRELKKSWDELRKYLSRFKSIRRAYKKQIYRPRCTEQCGVVRSFKRMQICGGCMCVPYCSRACQERDWANHRKVCQSLQEVARDPLHTPTGLQVDYLDWVADQTWKVAMPNLRKDFTEFMASAAMKRSNFRAVLFLDYTDVPVSTRFITGEQAIQRSIRNPALKQALDQRKDEVLVYGLFPISERRHYCLLKWMNAISGVSEPPLHFHVNI